MAAGTLYMQKVGINFDTLLSPVFRVFSVWLVLLINTFYNFNGDYRTQLLIQNKKRKIRFSFCANIIVHSNSSITEALRLHSSHTLPNKVHVSITYNSEHFHECLELGTHPGGFWLALFKLLASTENEKTKTYYTSILLNQTLYILPL